jgi:hypothetical protein
VGVGSGVGDGVGSEVGIGVTLGSGLGVSPGVGLGIGLAVEPGRVAVGFVVGLGVPAVRWVPLGVTPGLTVGARLGRPVSDRTTPDGLAPEAEADVAPASVVLVVNGPLAWITPGRPCTGGPFEPCGQRVTPASPRTASPTRASPVSRTSRSRGGTLVTAALDGVLMGGVLIGGLTEVATGAGRDGSVS